MQKDKVIETLMERDGMSREEADREFNKVIDKVREYMKDGRFVEAENAFSDMLGVDPEYMA